MAKDILETGTQTERLICEFEVLYSSWWTLRKMYAGIADICRATIALFDKFPRSHNTGHVISNNIRRAKAAVSYVNDSSYNFHNVDRDITKIQIE